jgi:hypothetical protein
MHLLFFVFLINAFFVYIVRIVDILYFLLLVFNLLTVLIHQLVIEPVQLKGVLDSFTWEILQEIWISLCPFKNLLVAII